MTTSLAIAQEDIRQYLAAQFAQPNYEGGVPSAQELPRVDGLVVPHIIYNFGDLAPTAERSLVGPRSDGYLQPLNIYSAAADIATARKLNNKVLDRFLGFQPTYSGPMRKRPGGGAFAIRTDNGAEEAFLVAASFVFSVEFISDVVPGQPISGNGEPPVLGFVDNGDGTGALVIN